MSSKITKRQELENALLNKGWEKDRFGHFKRSINNITKRFKMGKISCRYERLVNINNKNEWLNMSSKTLYYKNFKLNKQGLLFFS